MSPTLTLLTTALAAFTSALALPDPQGGSTGSGPSPLVVVRAYDAGGCTGNSQVLTFSNNGTCGNLAGAATQLKGVRSAKVIDYEIAGCNAVFSTSYPTCQLQGTAGVLSTSPTRGLWVCPGRVC